MHRGVMVAATVAALALSSSCSESVPPAGVESEQSSRSADSTDSPRPFEAATTSEDTRPTSAPARRPSQPVTLAAVGAIMLDRRVEQQIDRFGTNAVLTRARPELRGADVSVGP